MFEVHTWKCPEDTALYRKIVEQKRTFKFLLGLNKNLDEVRGRVMGTKPLPSIRETFSEVRREENMKKVMMGSQNSALSIEGSTFVARGLPSNTNSENRQKMGNLSVTTTENYDIPEKIAGRFMANQLIGSHPNHSMIEKVVPIMLLS